MKKFIAAGATATLLGLGLVGVSGSPASADCGYTSCINTTTVVSSKSFVRQGKKGKVTVVVGSAGGRPTGSVRIVVTRGGGNFKFAQTVPYTGSPVKVRTTKLNQRGTYIVKARFTSTDGGIFDNSQGRDTFRVG